jgi:Beta galactosidase small chain
METRKFRQPGESGAGYVATNAGEVLPVGAIAPGTSGKLKITPLPITAAAPFDAWALTAKDPNGKVLWTWVWPNKDLKYKPDVADSAKVADAQTADALTATVGDLSVKFDKKTGLLAAASRAGKTFSFANGPRFLSAAAGAGGGRGATPPPAQVAPVETLTSFTQKNDGANLIISAGFDGPLKSITYRLHPNGWVTIDYAYNVTGPHSYFGVGFDYPEANVKGMRYLGNGPDPVYQNRLAGGTLDVWEKKYNNTIVGDPDDIAPGGKFEYPMFKGFYNNVRWLQLQTTEGPITAVLNQEDLFVQVFTPKLPPAAVQGNTAVAFPKSGINFLHAIPAIGNKFSSPASTGPMGNPTVGKGDYTGSISLYFGEIH